MKYANVIVDISHEKVDRIFQYRVPEALEERLDTAEQDREALQTQLQSAGLTVQAMDWFWQIDEAYVRGRYAQCRELIQDLEDAQLADWLPTESITDNGRFSPADRYLEIREKVMR